MESNVERYPWPEILLADRSRMQLEVYADWLTEGGDPLADGIRWLAREEKRPTVFTAVPMIAWNIRNSGSSHLPKEISERMDRPIRYLDHQRSAAEVYHDCLVDAARAYMAHQSGEPLPAKRIHRRAAFR